MNRSIVVTLVLILGGVLAWLALRTPAEPAQPSGPARGAAERKESEPAPPTARTRDAAPKVARVDRKRRVSKAERDEFRKLIAEGVARREAQRERGEPTREDEPEPAAEEQDDAETPSEGITDRTGGKFGTLIGAINDDFLPLAQECYEQALETDPELRGMLDMNFQIIADEDIGGIVDEVELGEENELHNPGMHECVRETMLSTLFPPPPDSGSTGVRLTLRFEPEQPSE